MAGGAWWPRAQHQREAARPGVTDVDQAGKITGLAALSKLAPELADTFVSLAGDIALVIDAQGVIDKVAFGGGGALAPGADAWVGRCWAETVTGETRGKVDELLREAGANGISRRREINHPLPNGVDIPVSYTAVRLGVDGPVLAVGRDLRAITGIQQQFVEAQQEIEREYWKHRQAESRYRVLFQVATDAVLVIDAGTLCIVDANQAASGLFDLPVRGLIGADVLSLVDRLSRPAVNELLSAARASGQAGEVKARLAGRRVSGRVSATPFRSADATLLLLRIRAVDAGTAAADTRWTLLKLVECTPDAIVVVDADGRILMANPAFIDLAQFADEGQARGRYLADLVGPELVELTAAARSQGIAAGRTMALLGLHGRRASIEVSGALLQEEDQQCVGLSIRVRKAVDAAHAPGEVPPRCDSTDLAAAIDALSMQVGLLDLSQLLAKVAERAERHFVRAALRRSARDRSEAARLLGLSTDAFEARLRTERQPRDGDGAGSVASD